MKDQVQITSAKTKQDFEGIASLNKKYLFQNLTQDERREGGYLMRIIDLQILQKISSMGPNRIFVGKYKSEIYSYLIYASKNQMMKSSQFIDEVNALEKIKYKEKFLTDYNYLHGLQVLVQKQFRKNSIWLEFLNNIRHLYEKQYDFFIITVSKFNIASLESHKRVGFIQGQDFINENNQEGIVLILEWKNLKAFPLNRSQI